MLRALTQRKNSGACSSYILPSSHSPVGNWSARAHSLIPKPVQVIFVHVRLLAPTAASVLRCSCTATRGIRSLLSACEERSGVGSALPSSASSAARSSMCTESGVEAVAERRCRKGHAAQISPLPIFQARALSLLRIHRKALLRRSGNDFAEGSLPFGWYTASMMPQHQGRTWKRK